MRTHVKSYEAKLGITRPCATIHSDENEIVPKNVKHREIMQTKASLYKGVAQNPQTYRTEHNVLKPNHRNWCETMRNNTS